jgi:hypothetical protein
MARLSGVDNPRITASCTHAIAPNIGHLIDLQ